MRGKITAAVVMAAAKKEHVQRQGMREGWVILFLSLPDTEHSSPAQVASSLVVHPTGEERTLYQWLFLIIRAKEESILCLASSLKPHGHWLALIT